MRVQLEYANYLHGLGLHDVNDAAALPFLLAGMAQYESDGNKEYSLCLDET